MYIQVKKHEWADDELSIIAYCKVYVKRVNEDKYIDGGGFILFVKPEDISNYALGSKFTLQPINDIIAKEN